MKGFVAVIFAIGCALAVDETNQLYSGDVHVLQPVHHVVPSFVGSAAHYVQPASVGVAHLDAAPLVQSAVVEPAAVRHSVSYGSQSSSKGHSALSSSYQYGGVGAQTVFSPADAVSSSSVNFGAKAQVAPSSFNAGSSFGAISGASAAVKKAYFSTAAASGASAVSQKVAPVFVQASKPGSSQFSFYSASPQASYSYSSQPSSQVYSSGASSGFSAADAVSSSSFNSGSPGAVQYSYSSQPSNSFRSGVASKLRTQPSYSFNSGVASVAQSQPSYSFRSGVVSGAQSQPSYSFKSGVASVAQSQPSYFFRSGVVSEAQSQPSYSFNSGVASVAQSQPSYTLRSGVASLAQSEPSYSYSSDASSAVKSQQFSEGVQYHVKGANSQHSFTFKPSSSFVAQPVVAQAAFRHTASPVYHSAAVSKSSYTTPEGAAVILHQSGQLNEDGSFNYGFQSDNGIQAVAESQVRSLGPKDVVQVVHGSYSYTAPDGSPITVNYVADENGFHAEGAHLPTPPPIPEAIARSLQNLPVESEQQRIQPIVESN